VTLIETARREFYFTPAELGKRVGMTPKLFNQWLESCGFQRPSMAGMWGMTELGQPFGMYVNTERKQDGLPIQYTKWKAEVIEAAREVERDILKITETT